MAAADTVTTGTYDDVKTSANGEDVTCLDFPRIHFYGRFRCNIGTGNNITGNYKLAMEYPAGEGEKAVVGLANSIREYGPGYLYNGDMTYNWLECGITAAYGKNGVVDTTIFKGFEINPSTRQVSGRMNDLDVWQQMISRIFGFEVNICNTNNNNEYLFRSKLQPCSFRDIWFRGIPSVKEVSHWKGGDQLMSCTYGSILTDCKFADDEKLVNFPVLMDLKRSAIANDNKLQIKFVMDGYNSTDKLETYGYGRVFGCIGCYTLGSPTKAIKNSRKLISNVPGPAFSSHQPLNVGNMSNQYCIIKTTIVQNKTKLIVDLSNAIPTRNYNPATLNSNDFDPVSTNIGDVIIYQLQGSSSSPKNVKVGSIPSSEYSDMEQWRINCGIFCVDIENGVTVDEKYPLMVQFGEELNGNIELNALNTERNNAKNPLTDTNIYGPLAPIGQQLFEPKDGWFISSEDLPFRLGTVGIYEPINCPKQQSFSVYASKYGKPIDSNDLNVMTTVTPFQWQPVTKVGSSEPQDKPAGWKKLTKEFKCEIIKTGPVKNGIFQVSIKAPNTLEDETTKLLPRHYWWMDSVVWNLVIRIHFNQNQNQLIKTDHDAVGNTEIQTTPIGHSNFTAVKQTLAVETEEEKGNPNAKNTLNFLIGSALVFEELPPDKMPSVPLWQPKMSTDLSDTNWKAFLNSDEFKKPYVHKILRPYQTLYPIMSNIVNLDSFEDITSKLDSMIRAFNQPWESPYYMPITRDMSGMNQVVVKEWLRNPVFCDKFVEKVETLGGFIGVIRDVDTLKQYLQAAIELELSTLPPYLSALYSMDPTNNQNTKIIQLLRSIVHQEMQHFALACNLLLSIGGKPKIAFKDVVERTTFPRIGLKPATKDTLPVLPELPLELRPMSVDGKNASVLTFMKIEAPCPFVMDHYDESQENIHSGAKGNITTKLLNSNPSPLKRTTFTRNLTGTSNNNNNNNNGDEDEDSKNVESNTNEDNIALHVLFSTINNNDIETNNNNNEITFLKDLDTTDLKHSGIGAYYQLIRKGFAYLSRNDEIGQDKLFVNYNDKNDCIYNGQIGPSMMPGCNFVYDLDSALTAIETIVSEGEGTSITDIWQDGVNEANLSHFHKFLEIRVGYPIIAAERIHIGKNDHAVYRYIFAKNPKEKINFNDMGVEMSGDAWDWLKLGKDGSKNDTTKNKNANDIRVITFNETYGKLLCALQDMVDPEILGTERERKEMTFVEIEQKRQRQIKKAIGVMRQLQINYGECLTPEVMPGYGPLIDGAPVPPKYQPLAPNWVPPDYSLYSDE